MCFLMVFKGVGFGKQANVGLCACEGKPLAISLLYALLSESSQKGFHLLRPPARP